MEIEELIKYLQQKQKEGFTHVAVEADGKCDCEIGNLIRCYDKNSDGSAINYISIQSNYRSIKY